MKPNKQKSGSTFLAWSVSMMMAVPLATLVGGFAGWAMCGAAGEWLESLGVANAMIWGHRIGGVLGAALCPAYVAYKAVRDTRITTNAPPEGRETRAS